VRLADGIGKHRLDKHDQEHTETGAHRVVTTKFPTWVPAEVMREAENLEERDALAILSPFTP